MHVLEDLSCFFGTTTVFLGQEVHYYMVYIAYYTESNLQKCNYVQNKVFVAKKGKYTPEDIFMSIFALAERLPTSATLCEATTLCKATKKLCEKTRKTNLTELLI